MQMIRAVLNPRCSGPFSCFIRRKVHSRSLSTTTTDEKISTSSVVGPVLLRDYIQQSLYHHGGGGYFTTDESLPILDVSGGDIRRVLRIREMRDEEEYSQGVRDLYRRYAHGWLTPVELFSPYLSRAIANYVARTCEAQGFSGVDIIEMGPGLGTLGREVLEFLSRDTEKRDDSNCLDARYFFVDISPSMAKQQARTARKWIDSGQAQSVVCDIRKWTFPSSARDRKVFVIGTEVLDNLGHDLIRTCSSSSSVEQALINILHHDVLQSDRFTRTLEWTDELDDETIKAYNTFYPPDFSASSSQTSNNVRKWLDSIIMANDQWSYTWVPTVCYQILRSILNQYPSASFILSDFTNFPSTLQGTSGPVVQRVCQGTAVVYDAIDEAPFGQVDIMFPTDFQRLAHAHQQLFPGPSQCKYSIMSQRQFFQRFAACNDIEASTCKNGFNPILHQFDNVSFLLIDSQTVSP